MERQRRKIYPTEVSYANRAKEATKGADICFMFTERKEIKDLKPVEYKKLMKDAVIYDGRNIYNVEEMKENKVKYYSIGRSLSNELKE